METSPSNLQNSNGCRAIKRNFNAPISNSLFSSFDRTSDPHLQSAVVNDIEDCTFHDVNTSVKDLKEDHGYFNSKEKTDGFENIRPATSSLNERNQRATSFLDEKNQGKFSMQLLVESKVPSSLQEDYKYCSTSSSYVESNLHRDLLNSQMSQSQMMPIATDCKPHYSTDLSTTEESNLQRHASSSRMSQPKIIPIQSDSKAKSCMYSSSINYGDSSPEDISTFPETVRKFILHWQQR